MNEPFSFEGKLVGFIFSANPETAMIPLQNARVETIGGRIFITGTIAGADSWIHGLPAAIAWDSVGYYVVFASELEYESRVKVGMRSRSKWDRLFGRKNA